MSKETYEKLEQAIREHILDEMDDATYLTDWALVTASATGETHKTRYYTDFSDTPHHGMLGLSQMLHQDVIRQGGWTQ